MISLKRYIVLIITLVSVCLLYAQTRSISQNTWGQRWGFEKTIGVQTYDMPFPVFGIDSVSAEWFEMCLHLSNPADYLDKQSDYVNYFGQTGGTWSNADAMLFSVQGNSYRMNRIYKDGFRIDSRFMPGVTFYKPNLFYHNLLLDTHQSKLNFVSIVNDDANFISVKGDMSGLFGGEDPGAFGHPSGGAYQMYPKNRSYTLGSGEIEMQYHVEDKQTIRYYRTFRHHAYVDGGVRAMSGIDSNTNIGLYHGGETGQKKNYYWRVEADGEIAMPSRKHRIERRDMVRMYYMVNALHRTGGQEFGYNPEEWYQMDYYTASVYFRSPEWNVNKYRLYGLRRPIWTMGVTYGLGRTYGIGNYARNMLDPDGMGIEPWMPNGRHHELSYSCTLNHDFSRWVSIHYEGYNSAILFNAQDKNKIQSHLLYYPSEFESPESYELRLDPGRMIGGLLENTVGIDVHYRRTKKFGMRLVVDATLDGFILGEKKSVIRPNWQAELAFDFRPLKVVQIGLTIANYRIPFSIDDMRFFSNTYNIGTIHTRAGEVFSTTGGKYHTLKPKTWQPQYFVIDLPIKFAPGRHEISFNTTYKKFYNLWTVNYAADAAEYGFFDDGVFYEKKGEKQYEVGYRAKQGNNIITNTPFFISNIIKYAFNGNHFYFSASWQTTIFNSTSVSNGFWGSDLMTLSERTANPNTNLVGNDKSEYATVHQIVPLGTARVMMGVNTQHWRIGLTAKYTNGNPMTYYQLHSSIEKERVAYYAANAGGGNLYNLTGGEWSDRLVDIDVDIAFRGMTSGGKLYQIQLVGYNLYDFASRLAGNAFRDNSDVYQYSLPRGVTLSFMLGL